MKTILLWNPRVPVLSPLHLTLPDIVASALVRCGVAAAADPAEQGELETGGPIAWTNLIEVAVETGPLQTIVRVFMPEPAVAVAAEIGIACAVDGANPGGGDIPAPVNTGKPALTDAQADGDMQTLDYGTWTDAATVSIQYVVEGVAVGGPVVVNYGDPAPTRAYDYASEVGKRRWVEVTATSSAGGASDPEASAIRVGVAQGTIIYNDFEGVPDNAKLEDLDGWDRTGSYTHALIIDGKIQVDDHNGGDLFFRDDGAYSIVRASVARNAGDGVSLGSTLRYIGLNMVDANNHVRLHVQDNGWGLVQVLAGTEIVMDFENFDPGFSSEGTRIEAESVVAGGELYYKVWKYDPGSEVKTRLDDETANDGLGQGPVDASLKSSFKTGLLASINGLSFPWALFNDWYVRVPPTNNVSVSVTDGVISPVDPTKQRIKISGGYTAPNDDFEWFMVDPDGNLAVAPTDVTGASAGAYSNTVDVAYANGGTPTIYVRNKADSTIVGVSTFTSLALPSSGLVTLGMNEGFVNGFAPADPFEDWASRIEWRDTSWNYIMARGRYEGLYYQVPSSADGADGTVKMDLDGRIYKDNSLGLTSYRLVIPAYFREPGSYVLKLAAGLNITRVNGSTTWSYAGDELTITTDANGRTDSAFDIALDGAFPAGGVLPVGKKQGGTYATRPQVPSTVAATISAVATGIRVMTSAGINNADNNEGGRTDTALPVDTVANSATAGPGINRMGADYAAAYAVDADIDFLWYVSRGISGTAYLEAEMGKIASLLTSTSHTTIPILSERGNEPWNSATAFYRSFCDAYLDGLRLGFAPIGVTTPGVATPETIVDGTPHIYNDGFLAPTSRTFTSGEIVFVNWSAQGGFVTINITATISAGGSLTLGANCTMRYDGAASYRAKLRGLAYRSKEKWTAEDAVLSAAGLPPSIHIFSHQAASNLADIQPALDFDGFKAMPDRIAIAPYWGGDLGTWSDAGWPKASKEKIYAGNTAGFIADFVTAATAAISAQVAHVRDAWVLPLANYSKANRGDKDAIGLAFYESGWHVTPNGWPDMCGLYAGGTTYEVGAFVLGSDGKTYARATVSGSNNPVSDPTNWAVYWDAATTTSHRGDGTTLRTIQAAFDMLKATPEFAALQKSYYQQMAALGVREMMYFDRIGVPQRPVSATAAISLISGWAAQRTEADTALTGEDTNHMFVALTELKAELSAV